jgi:hypothetical protein
VADSVKLPIERGFGITDRIDKWWMQPFWMAFALIVAVSYTALRVILWDGDIQYDNHRVTSPIFSPDVIHLFHLQTPSWMNSALLVLWIPFGFRGTCYYMRRVYHRVFFQNPTACVVSKPEINYRIGYKGETGLFVLNNIHRYMLYLAIIILSMKVFDVYQTMHFDGADRGFGFSVGTLDSGFGFSVGTLVLATESGLLFMYVGSCHAFRHLFGGSMNQWRGGLSGIMGAIHIKITNINVNHAFWFWTSLAMVFLGDLFVWAVSEGVIRDPYWIIF